VKPIIARWNRLGIACGPASVVALNKLARRWGYALPDSFRELYRASDGTSTMDRETIWWPVSVIADMASSEWLGFADFRQSAVTFFLKGSTGEVFVDAQRKIAGSFDQHLRQYARSRVYWQPR
jgi:hypothetical protein